MFRSLLRASTRPSAVPAIRLVGAVRLQSTFAPVGSTAPDFTADALVDREMKKISLSQYRGKWVLLFFYPLDFTFVCPTEIIAFSDKADAFRKIGAEVLGCSIDSTFSHYAWVEQPQKEGGLGKCNFPLISDITRKIGEQYGVMNRDTGFHLRGTYIIDPKGQVRHLSMNDPPVGRNVDEYLRLIEAYQYTDKHGEVCPVNWKPGSDTIKGHPEKKKEYFGKHGRDE